MGRDGGGFPNSKADSNALGAGVGGANLQEDRGKRDLV